MFSHQAGRSGWRAWCKSGARPANVPANPDKAYKDGGWQGWDHWLGSTHAQDHLPFDEALAVARPLSLDNTSEWELWCRSGSRPANLPSSPDRAYKGGGWQGWPHWLGTATATATTAGATACAGTGATKRASGRPTPSAQFLSFEEGLAFVRSLQLSSEAAWHIWCKSGARPPNLPANPGHIYKHTGWRGWGHWLAPSASATAKPSRAPTPGKQKKSVKPFRVLFFLISLGPPHVRPMGPHEANVRIAKRNRIDHRSRIIVPPPF